MTNLKLMFELYKKNNVLKISTIIAFVATLFYMGWEINSNMKLERMSVSILDRTVFLSVFYLIFFAFITYEYFFKTIKSKEIFQSINNGIKTIYKNQFLIMIIINFTFSMFLFLCNVGYSLLLKPNEFEYYTHIFFAILLYIFLASLMGILFGFLLSFLKKKITAYLLLVLYSFLCSPLLTELFTGLELNFDCNVFQIANIFSFSNPGIVTYAIVGVDILPYRWFWGFFDLVVFYDYII